MPSHSRDSDRETALDPEDDPRDLRAGEWIGPDGPVMWVIDPLDGTTNWLHGYPCYGLSIATLDRRGLRTGVVVNSGNGEEFVARRGGGATLDGEPIEVSPVEDIGLALLGTGFPFRKLELLPGYLASLGTMLRPWAERRSAARSPTRPT
ncbi:inositol monophosphatase family protein [Candidatus Palauibacter sp.]|uniref:inositol monophosphatase family protein n=1 Tax=Candidatus Palauibacter sp. TaxID=3101350 RepID=UPI003CC62A83